MATCGLVTIKLGSQLFKPSQKSFRFAGGGGGGDDWGHGNARPMLRLRRSSLLLASAVVSDGGKGLAAEESRVSLKARGNEESVS